MTDLDPAGPVVWPKWCYSIGPKSAPGSLSVTPAGGVLSVTPAGGVLSVTPAGGVLSVTPAGGVLAPTGVQPANKRRRKADVTKPSSNVKPEAGDRSPCESPGSLACPRGTSPAVPLSAVPLLAGHPAVLSSPSALVAPTSYSDLMRGLAAKYNNNNREHRDYFGSKPTSIIRSFDYGRHGSRSDMNSVVSSPTIPTEKMSPPSSQGDAVSPLLSVAPPHMTPFQGLPMLDVLTMCRSSGLATSASDYHHHLAASARSHQLQHPAQISRLKRSRTADVVPPAGTSPLDLSNIKRACTGADSGFRDLFGPRRTASPKQETQISPRSDHSSACSQTPCSPEGQAVAKWSVEDVVSFVRTIDECAQYAELFEEHRICGSSLAMLQTEHLTNVLGLKLGPALRFRAALNSRIGFCDVCSHCNHCHNSATGRDSTSSPSSPSTASSRHQSPVRAE